MSAGEVGEVDPKGAWEAIASQKPTLMIDVRTTAEWTFVGAPDLGALNQPIAFIEWQSYPAMGVNQSFAAEALGVAEQTKAEEIYFICRSGARSMHAAMTTNAAAAAAGRKVTCFNVAEGFEGDPDADGHRGNINGWKAHGLPWRQS